MKVASVTTREALAEAIHSAEPGVECSHSRSHAPCESLADALIARGAVTDATTLIPRTMPATPDAVMRYARTLRYGHYDEAADILTALAAALSGRSETEEGS